MKPLTHCPGCGTHLIKKTIPEHLNHMIYENCEARCPIDYFQYYRSSYDDKNVEYITFNTPRDKFNLYVYFDHYLYKNIVHVYSNAELKKHGMASPMLVINSSMIDVYKLDNLEEKLSTLALFV
jgi:hypothetical protein